MKKIHARVAVFALSVLAAACTSGPAPSGGGAVTEEDKQWTMPNKNYSANR